MSENNEVSVFVAFSSTNDVIEQTMKTHLSTAIETVFDADEFEYVSSNKMGNFIEIIFKFHRPLIMTEEDNDSFFGKLKTLFNITSTMTPHFTQVPTHTDEIPVISPEDSKND